MDGPEQMVVDEPLGSDVDGRLLPAQTAEAPSLVDVPMLGSCQVPSRETANRDREDCVSVSIGARLFSARLQVGRTFY